MPPTNIYIKKYASKKYASKQHVKKSYVLNKEEKYLRMNKVLI